MKSDTAIYLSLIAILTISLIVTLNHLSASPRGSYKNPILLYDTTQSAQIWYKNDTGSGGSIILPGLIDLYYQQNKTIDSLEKLQEAISVGFVPQPPTYDTFYVSANNPFKPLPQPKHAREPQKPPHYKEEEVIIEYYQNLAEEMRERLDCGCPHSGDSIDAALALYKKLEAFNAWKYDQAVMYAEVAEYRKEICKELK